MAASFEAFIMAPSNHTHCYCDRCHDYDEEDYFVSCSLQSLVSCLLQDFHSGDDLFRSDTPSSTQNIPLHKLVKGSQTDPHKMFDV